MLATLVAGLVAALVLTWFTGPTTGGILLGADLVVAAVLRLVLPVRIAGALAVRSRAVDVAILLVLAVSCIALAGIVPTPS